MKAKKLISILLSLVMLLGALPVLAVTASAADTSYTYYYYEDFENLSPDLTSEQIAEALGWDEWDHSVATLKIVETVYMREFNAKASTEINANAVDLAKALGMTVNEQFPNDQSKGVTEWSHYRNIKIVDVAKIKSVADFKDFEFTDYKSYNKKLLIIPKALNENTSVVLTDNVDLGASAVFVDYELTPNFQETKETDNGAKVARTYTSDSSVGITLSNAGGASVTQELMVNASFRYTYYDGEDTANNKVDDILCNDWYNTALGHLYQNSTDSNTKINLDHSNQTYRTYADIESGSLFLSKANSLNGYRFTYRMKFSNDGFSSFVGNSANVTDIDTTSYMTSTSDPGQKSTAWQSLSSYRSNVDTGAKALMDGTTGSASLSVNHAGVAYYVDNIVVANFNGTINNVKPAVATVTVNGVEKKYRAGTSVYMQSFTPDEALVYATVDGSTDLKLAGDLQTIADGMTVNTIGVDIETRYGAAARLDTFTGLRWITDVNKADFDALAADENVTDIVIGTVIAPTSSLATKSWTELDAAANECLRLETTKDELVKSDVTNGNYTFKGSIVGIKKANYEKDFSGIGYISMTVDGKTVTVFGNYSEESHSRNVKTVAGKALADVYTAAERAEAADADKYTNVINIGDTYYAEDGTSLKATEILYSPYTEDERATLENFLEG